jgi:hypothetical protein
MLFYLKNDKKNVEILRHRAFNYFQANIYLLEKPLFKCSKQQPVKVLER